jgi:hypothetical protein
MNGKESKREERKKFGLFEYHLVQKLQRLRSAKHKML